MFPGFNLQHLRLYSGYLPLFLNDFGPRGLFLFTIFHFYDEVSFLPDFRFPFWPDSFNVAKPAFL